MIKAFICGIGFCVLNASFSIGQYYDTNYVEDISHKVLLGYFQEYSNSSLSINPLTELNSEGNESLLLQSDVNLYSGLLLQYKTTSIYIAGNTPQSQESIEKFGRQSYSTWNINYAKDGLFAQLRQVNQTGFSDINFDLHAFSDSTEKPFTRYENLNANRISMDVKYYPGFEQFSQGIPHWFGLMQKKSKFSLGYKLSYNHLKIDNNETALFSDTLGTLDDVFTLRQSTYNGVTVAFAPSVYLVAKQRFFIYADVWLGIDVNQSKLLGSAIDTKKVGVGFVIPEFRVAMGYQNDRWIFALYNSYVNQQFSSSNINSNLAYNKFGALIGFRFFAPARMAF